MAVRLSPREILDRLVAFPTVSSDSNLELVDWVANYLDGFGVSVHRDLDETGTKASLFAHVGPEVAGGIVLSGHTDVVPIEGQDWTSNPWEVTERDGRLYGRGTCDMKGFDAIALAAVPMALDKGVRRPLQIALSRDEEIGCVGAPSMIRQMVKHMPQAATAIIGEPSMMKIVNGHKGGTGFHVHIRGHEVHSSIMHTGVNAIMQAAGLIDWANQTNAANRKKTPTELAEIFDPPWTTLHVGTIRGGTAHNITAGDCWLGFDFRVVPGEDIGDWVQKFRDKIASIEAEMKAVHPDCQIHLDQYFDVPPLRPEQDGEAEQIVRLLTGENGSGVVSYGTEAGQFQDAGYSAIVCGPGDIAQAHQPDEFLAVEQFQAGIGFVERLTDQLAN